MSPQISRFPFSLHTQAAAIAAVFAAALLPTAVLADEVDAYVTHITSQRLEVLSNGSSYATTNPFANLVADVNIEVDTDTAGRVKSWKIWLGIAGETSDSLWFPSYGKSKSYPWYDRPRRVDRTEQLIVPASAWSGYVKARCNELADALRAQGLGNTAIFSEDRKVELAVMAGFDVDTTGAGSGSILSEGSSWGAHAKLDLICKKWSGAAVPQASDSITVTPAKVVNKGLSILERHGATGVCKIRLDGWITTDQKNAEVSFRYKNQDGKESQLWSVNTGESKTATFSHWYDIPNTEWAETGSVRMVGVSHDFKSAWAEYTMDCVEGGPNTLTANDPPQLKMTFVEQDKVMVHGQICPQRLKLVGLLEGRGGFSGHATFVAKNGYTWFSSPQAYSITPGQKVLIGADYELDWSDTLPPAGNEAIRSDPRFDFNVTNDDNAIISSLKNQMRLVVCKRPVLNPVGPGGQGLTVEPRLPAGTAAPRKLQLQSAPSSSTPQLILPRQPLKQAR